LARRIKQLTWSSKLIQAAHKKLAEKEPAAFLVILLGLCVSLRKGEIDLLPPGRR
jgi:hypothetical protein